jgi:methylglutaconyl-CoA hydratase
MVACCDFAMADESSKFCLSEARLGLLPAVIAPYLLRKMNPGQLRRMALTSRPFDVNDAKQFGLIEVATTDLDDAVHEEVKALLACGPEAQKAINRLFDTLRLNNYSQCEDTVQAIAKARTGKEGQAGLQSFFNKATPPWVRSVKHSDIQEKL